MRQYVYIHIHCHTWIKRGTQAHIHQGRTISWASASPSSISRIQTSFVKYLAIFIYKSIYIHIYAYCHTWINRGVHVHTHQTRTLSWASALLWKILSVPFSIWIILSCKASFFCAALSLPASPLPPTPPPILLPPPPGYVLSLGLLASSLPCVTGLVHSYVWHESLFHTCDMTVHLNTSRYVALVWSDVWGDLHSHVWHYWRDLHSHVWHYWRHLHSHVWHYSRSRRLQRPCPNKPRSNIQRASFACVTFNTWHVAFICVTRVICMCDMTNWNL